MRKSCRWLGCAALMCFATLDLSGGSSAYVEAGLKLPWRKDRGTVTKKESKSKAEESTELLDKARDTKRASGEPSTIKGQEDPQASVAKTEKKSFFKWSREKNKPAEKSPVTESETRLTSKSKNEPAKKPRDPDFERNLGLTDQGTSEDPWANQPQKKEVATAEVTETPMKKGDSPAWAAESDSGESLSGTSKSVVSKSPPKQGQAISQESLDNLLDMDAGQLNWGDERADAEKDLPADSGTATQLAQAETPSAETSAADPLTDAPAADAVEVPVAQAPEKTTEAGLPLIDFNAKEDLQAPVTNDVAATEKSGDHEWANTPSDREEGVANDLAAATTPPALPSDDLTPPIVEDDDPQSSEEKVAKQSRAVPVQSPAADEGVSTDAEAHAPQSQSLAAKCQSCEPWVYAQVVKLDSTDPDVRKEGLSRLAEMERKAHPAAAAIRATLKDKDPYVQAQAAWAWWVIEGDAFASVETLKTLLKHSDANVVELACYILGDIGAPADSTTSSLVLLRDHSDGTTQVQTAEALIRIAGVDDKSLKVLTSALKSKDGQVRWGAAVALGRCRGSETSAAVVTALTGALKDVDPEVRSAAALSLGGLGKDAEKATPELQRIASSDNEQVREAALAALACLNL